MRTLFFVLFFLYYSLSYNLTAQEIKRDTVVVVYEECAKLVKDGRLMEAVKRLTGLLNKEVQLSEKQKLIVNNNLGILLNNLGQYDIALNHYNIAESIYLNNSFKEISFLVSIYGNKANIFTAKGDYIKALEFTEKAIRFIQGSNAPSTFKQQSSSSLYINKGVVYRRQNNLELAISSFNKSIALKNKFNLSGKDKAYLHLARTVAKMGNAPLADKYYNLSISASEAEFKKQSFQQVNIYIDYSYFLLSVNENSKALNVIQKALNINLMSFGEKNQITSSCYQFLGDYYRKVKDYQKALTYYQKALISGSKDFNDPKIESNPSLDDINFNMWQLRLLHRKAEVLAMKAEEENEKPAKINDLLIGFNTMNLAIDMTRTIRGDYQDQETRLIFNEMQKNVFVSAIETAIKLSELTGERNYLNQAFQKAQQYKANELKYEIARNRMFASVDLADSLKNKEKTLLSDIAGYNLLIRNELALPKPDTSKIIYWKDQQFDLKRLYEKQLDVIKRKYPRFIDKIESGNIVSVDSIQAKLKPDETLIEYIISEKDDKGVRKLYEFVLTQKSLVCHNEVMDSTVASNFLNLKELIANQFTEQNGIEQYNRMNQLLYYAYSVLIEPIKKNFAGNKLIIIPDDEISYLPFDAFLTSWTTKKRINYSELPYLIRDYTISYGYSTNTLFDNQVNASRFPKIIGFAPDYSVAEFAGDDRFIMLKSNAIETESILNYFGGAVLKGNEATISNFRSGLNKGAILHLAMHAELDTIQAGSSSLIFAPDKNISGKYQLFNYEIGQMKIESPMVVLSACSSGNGKLYRGEGLMSLARNFVLAGVPSVVETLWPVDDKASSKIMGSFYKYLAEGLPKNIALRQAKLDYIDSTSPSFVNPKFWASYTLVGDTAEVKKIWWKNPLDIIVVILAVSVMIVLLISYLRSFKIR